jgi:hypothetical protein
MMMILCRTFVAALLAEPDQHYGPPQTAPNDGSHTLNFRSNDEVASPAPQKDARVCNTARDGDTAIAAVEDR